MGSYIIKHAYEMIKQVFREREGRRGMSSNRQYMEQMRAMGLPTYEAQLENEASRLKAENTQLKTSMDDSIRAHRIMINELQGQIAEYACIEAERDQLKAELDAYRRGGLTEEILRRHDGYIKLTNGCAIVRGEEYTQLKAELAQCQQDLKDAAGELRIPMPEAGTDMARLLSANVILRQREARLREALQGFTACMRRYGAWEDGCFYYNGRSATEFQRPMEQASELLKEAS